MAFLILLEYVYNILQVYVYIYVHKTLTWYSIETSRLTNPTVKYVRTNRIKITHTHTGVLLDLNTYLRTIRDLTFPKRFPFFRMICRKILNCSYVYFFIYVCVCIHQKHTLMLYRLRTQFFFIILRIAAHD